MRKQLVHGRLKFLSFIVLNLISLIIANVLAAHIYNYVCKTSYDVRDYYTVVVYMAIIDIVVIIAFNTLNSVMRREKRKEIIESFKHVIISFVILALLLFTTKQGAAYSRVTIFMAYGLYFVLILIFRTVWKELLRRKQVSKATPTVLLITTNGYANEGLMAVENAGMTVKGMFITDKTNEGVIRDIPVIVDREDAASFLCWEWIDKIYICGPEGIDVPESLLAACMQMGIQVYKTPTTDRFYYEVIKIRTALQKNDMETGLSFFEGEHDIPFNIRRLYMIYESEQEKQKGFHAHKRSWHLLFCPYGSIDVIIDTGREKKSINLSNPSIGLILHPSVWREMVWKKEGSVLCVAASGHYDYEKLKNNYDDYVKFLQEREWSATVESAEILGEAV